MEFETVRVKMNKELVEKMRFWTIDSPEFWREHVKNLIVTFDYYDIPSEFNSLKNIIVHELKDMMNNKRYPSAKVEEFNSTLKVLINALKSYFIKKEEEEVMKKERVEDKVVKKVQSFSVTQNSEYEYTFKGASSVTVDEKEAEIEISVEVYDGTVVYHKAEVTLFDTLFGATFKRLPRKLDLPELSLTDGESGIRDVESVFRYLFLMTDITNIGDHTLVSVDQATMFEDPDYEFVDPDYEYEFGYGHDVFDIDSLECA